MKRRLFVLLCSMFSHAAWATPPCATQVPDQWPVGTEDVFDDPNATLDSIWMHVEGVLENEWESGEWDRLNELLAYTDCVFADRFPAEYASLYEVHVTRGQVAYNAGQYNAAVAYYAQSLSGLRKTDTKDPEQLFQLLSWLAEAQWNAGIHEEALSTLSEARALANRNWGIDSEQAADVAHHFGLNHEALNQMNEAADAHEIAYDFYRKQWGARHPATLAHAVNFENALYYSGQYGRARALNRGNGPPDGAPDSGVFDVITSHGTLNENEGTTMQQ